MRIAMHDNALSRAILSGVTQLPDSLDSQVSFSGATHVLLRYAAASAYLRLPAALRCYLAHHGVRFVLGLYYDAASITGPQEALSPDRRDNVRRHRNQSPGVYDKRARIAYAFAFRLRSDVRPTIGQQPDAQSVAAGTWQINGTRAVARITRHEVWHALDDIAGLRSRRPAFRQAYLADVTALGGAEAARRAGWSYFIQDDIPHRGQSEVFAECGAALNGGGVRGKDILAAFPRCTRIVAQFQAELIAAWQPLTPVAQKPGFQNRRQAYLHAPPDDLSPNRFQMVGDIAERGRLSA